MKRTTDWNVIERAESQKLRQEMLREHEKQIKHYADALAETKDALNVSLAVSRQRPKPKPILAVGDGKSEAVAFAIASDWHCEERVRPESVNGLNEFSLSVADARINRFFRSVLNLTNIERGGTRIDTLVLGLLGDLMTGYIHEELQESNELSPT